MKKAINLLLMLFAASTLLAQQKPIYEQTKTSQVLSNYATLARYYIGFPTGTVPHFPAFVADSDKCKAVFNVIPGVMTPGLYRYNCATSSWVIVGGSPYTFGGGLTNTSGFVSLGGSLINDVSIDALAYQYNMGGESGSNHWQIFGQIGSIMSRPQIRMQAGNDNTGNGSSFSLDDQQVGVGTFVNGLGHYIYLDVNGMTVQDDSRVGLRNSSHYYPDALTLVARDYVDSVRHADSLTAAGNYATIVNSNKKADSARLYGTVLPTYATVTNLAKKADSARLYGTVLPIYATGTNLAKKADSTRLYGTVLPIYATVINVTKKADSTRLYGSVLPGYATVTNLAKKADSTRLYGSVLPGYATVTNLTKKADSVRLYGTVLPGYATVTNVTKKADSTRLYGSVLPGYSTVANVTKKADSIRLYGTVLPTYATVANVTKKADSTRLYGSVLPTYAPKNSPSFSGLISLGLASINTVTGYGDFQGLGSENAPFYNNQYSAGANSNDGYVQQNQTPATSGAQAQWSGQYRWKGSVWNTSGTPAANEYDFAIDSRVYPGTVPYSLMFWRASLGTSLSYSDILSLSNTGVLTTYNQDNYFTEPTTYGPLTKIDVNYFNAHAVAGNKQNNLNQINPIVYNNGSGLAVADGTTDNSAALTAAFSSNQTVILDGTTGKFKITSTIVLNNITNLTVIGQNGATITTSTLPELMYFTGACSNITFIGVKFESTLNNNTTDNQQGLVYTRYCTTFNNTTFDRCEFTAPNITTNGLKFIVQSGDIVNNQTITNCNFHDLGRMGVEWYGGDYSTYYIQNINVIDNFFNNLGTVTPTGSGAAYGMGVSLSAYGNTGKVSHNTFTDCVVTGIEDIDVLDCQIDFNTFKSTGKSYNPIVAFSHNTGSTNYFITGLKIIGNNANIPKVGSTSHTTNITNTDGAIITCNTINADALTLDFANNSTVADNRIYGDGGAAILLLDASSYNYIENNRLDYSSGQAINIASTTALNNFIGKLNNLPNKPTGTVLYQSSTTAGTNMGFKSSTTITGTYADVAMAYDIYYFTGGGTANLLAANSVGNNFQNKEVTIVNGGSSALAITSYGTADIATYANTTLYPGQSETFKSDGTKWQVISGVVTPTQVITNVANLTTNGPVITSGSNGTLGVGTTTGSGAYVQATSPTMVTPTLGAATATSINKVAFTTPASLATVNIASGTTLKTLNSITLDGAGQTTLVAGTKAITITGVTTSSQATVTIVSPGGTVTSTWQYKAVCTSNTVTITAITTAGATNTTDTSILNYTVVN